MSSIIPQPHQPFNFMQFVSMSCGSTLASYFLLHFNLQHVNVCGTKDRKLTVSHSPIEAGQVFLSIPKSLLLTPRTSRNKLNKCAKCSAVWSPIGQSMKGSVQSLTWPTLYLIHMRLCIATQSNEMGFLAEYFTKSYLPQDLHLPFNLIFSKSPHSSILTCLPSWVQQRVVTMHLEVTEEFQRVEHILESMLDSHSVAVSDEVMKETFAWAFMCINTRVVYCGLNSLSRGLAPPVHPKRLQRRASQPTSSISESPSVALVPLFDLLNHSPHVDTTLRVTHSEFQVISNTPFPVGEEVLINYGPHDNVKLYIEYGFTIPHNPHRFLPIRGRTILKVFQPVVDSCSTFIERKQNCLLNTIQGLRLCDDHNSKPFEQQTSHTAVTGTKKQSCSLIDCILPQVGFDANGPSFLLLVLVYVCLHDLTSIMDWNAVACLPSEETLLLSVKTFLVTLCKRKKETLLKKKMSILKLSESINVRDSTWLSHFSSIEQILDDFLNVLECTEKNLLQ